MLQRKYCYKFSKIVELNRINLVGLTVELDNDTSLNYHKVIELWKLFNSRIKDIQNRINNKDWVKFGISCDSNKKKYTYLASIEVSKVPINNNGFQSKTIKAQKYLVFTHYESMEHLILSTYSIYKEWLPNSNYTVSDNSISGINHMEKYDKRFNWTKINSEIDILIPIQD